MNKASDITEDACWLLPKVTDFSRTFDILTHYCRSPSSFSLCRLLAGSNFTIYATIQRVNMVRVYSCVTLQTNKLKGHFSSAGMRKKDTLLEGPSKKKNMKAVFIASLNRPVCLWYDTAASHWGTNTLSDSTEDRETGNWEERQCVPWRLYNRNIGLKWHFFFFLQWYNIQSYSVLVVMDCCCVQLVWYYCERALPLCCSADCCCHRGLSLSPR